jgi:hypothetical protein
MNEAKIKEIMLNTLNVFIIIMQSWEQKLDEDQKKLILRSLKVMFPLYSANLFYCIDNYRSDIKTEDILLLEKYLPEFIKNYEFTNA